MEKRGDVFCYSYFRSTRYKILLLAKLDYIGFRRENGHISAKYLNFISKKKTIP